MYASYKVQSYPYSRIHKVYIMYKMWWPFCPFPLHSLFWSDWSATFCLNTCIIFSFKPRYTLIFCITLDKVLTEGSLNTSWSILYVLGLECNKDNVSALFLCAPHWSRVFTVETRIWHITSRVGPWNWTRISPFFGVDGWWEADVARAVLGRMVSCGWSTTLCFVACKKMMQRWFKYTLKATGEKSSPPHTDCKLGDNKRHATWRES